MKDIAADLVTLKVCSESALMQKRILTGGPSDRPAPSRPLCGLARRIGLRLQDEYDTYVLIADVQALTDNFEHRKNSRPTFSKLRSTTSRSASIPRRPSSSCNRWCRSCPS